MADTLHIHCNRVGHFDLLNVDPNFLLVSHVKADIECQKRIPTQKQKLTFQGVVFEDDHRLKEYGIESGSTLFLSVPLDFAINIKVSITIPSGPVVNLWANEKDTVSTLKKQIRRLYHWSAKAYEFVFGDAFLKENQTLASCGLKNGSSLKIMRYVSAELESTL
ncbi:unnamed protein product, partial [Dibothriocephalus latus]